MIVFGPIPSRRLGRSLGINNIPPKICTYSCVYCQVGRTTKMQTKRQPFYSPEEIVEAVKQKVDQVKKAGETIDYLTFVPDGEPTLDINLGKTIRLLQPLDLKIAVISSAALIWRPDVREDLHHADWVSLKIDAIRKDSWRNVDRPHGQLSLEDILQGIRTFAQSYRGTLVTETMLIKGLNDRKADINALASFLAQINPDAAYLLIPTRPPAEKQIQPPDHHTVIRSYDILSRTLDNVEYLIGYEGDAFSSTGDIEEDLLSITSVHPMRKNSVQELLNRTHEEWSVVERLIRENKLAEVTYNDNKFYMKTF